MDQQGAPARRVPMVMGAALVALGVVFLLAQQLQIDLGGAGWPLWVIAPGVVIAAAGLAVGGSAGSGFTAVGSMVTMTGLVLLYQDQTGHWESWAYAWALVAPGAVGAGLLLHGLVTGRADLVRGGATAAVTGIAIFLIGALFFEVVLGIGGQPLGEAGNVLLPAAIIVLGALILVAAFFPGRAGTETPSWSGRPPSAGAPGTSRIPPAASGFASTTSTDAPIMEDEVPPAASGAPAGAEDRRPAWDPGAGGPAAAGDARTGGDRTGPSGGDGPSGPETLAFDLGGASRADVQIEFGAGRLSLSGAAAGKLIEGSFSQGSVRHDVTPDGQVRLTSAVLPVGWAGWPPHEWRVGVTTEVPVRLRVATGASETNLDLTDIRVAELHLKVGASESRVRLPRTAGTTLVDAEVGAAKLVLQVPPGVAARIRTAMTLGSAEIDTRRFPPVAGGYASPDYEQAANRVQIDFRGGIGSLEVR